MTNYTFEPVQPYILVENVPDGHEAYQGRPSTPFAVRIVRTVAADSTRRHLDNKLLLIAKTSQTFEGQYLIKASDVIGTMSAKQSERTNRRVSEPHPAQEAVSA